jgi:hydrogenase expression/formation protein HypE
LGLKQLIPECFNVYKILSNRALPEGKLPMNFLRAMLDSIPRGNLIVAPKIGVDVGVSKIRGKYLVSSSDPITGTHVKMGWYAVNVSANDVATSGIMPDVLNVVALFPSKTRATIIQRVMTELNKTAAELGIAVAGGHTEITPLLKRPVLIVTAMGSGNKFVTAADARSFDSILMTKTAGIEGASILASLPTVKEMMPPRDCRDASSMLKHLSIIKEANIAFRTGRVHAMHDVTEGGILGAVYEMSVASNLGFEIFQDSIPVEDSTQRICQRLSVNPLRLIGSGSLLLACGGTSTKLITRRLRAASVRCTEIGKFLPLRRGRLLKTKRKQIALTERSIEDEIWDALRKYGDLS